MTSHRPPLISSFISDYGMIIGLLLLCVFFSYVTWDEQHATGLGAANQLRENITKEFPPGSTVLIVARNHQEDVNFADSPATTRSNALTIERPAPPAAPFTPATKGLGMRFIL